jgi:hypothetical protein
MTDDSTHETEQTLTAWADALTEVGWTPQPAKEVPAHLAGLRHLIDPAGAVEARAHAYPEEGIEVTLLSTARYPDGGAAWHVIAGWLSAETVIAAARAAEDAAVGHAAGELLTTAGWTLQRYEAFGPMSAEHQWASPDDTRWAVFTTPDPDPEGNGGDGGWILARPGDGGRQQRITASASTPSATITALSLADLPAAPTKAEN